MKNFGFFIAKMPTTRPADYSVGCLEGSVFIDFISSGSKISLFRISFDGYGACTPDIENIIPLSEKDSANFKEIFKNEELNQEKLEAIISKTLIDNRKVLWEDALSKYGFI